jgi:hypothetical protein
MRRPVKLSPLAGLGTAMPLYNLLVSAGAHQGAGFFCGQTIRR